MSETRAPAPTALVLFGATGDLAARMVLPAVAALFHAGLLPERWRLVGNGRGEQSDDDFRQHVREVLDDDADGGGDGPGGGSGGGSEAGPPAGFTDEQWSAFAASLRFAGGGFSADDPGQLPDVLAAARDELGEGAQVVHYLALPPSTFVPYTEALRDHGLADGARVVYEKPYGASREAFEELDRLVLSVVDEERVFRLDHFLGKEAVQQLHALRRANGWVERLWGSDAVEQVQVDVPEVLDVADRAEFYDATGATLDMLVTHLLQVAAAVALELPAGAGPEQLVAARAEALAAVRPLDPAEVVLGQVEGYRDLPEVADGSRTDTFTAATAWVDTDRWRGVPFHLRSGKQLAGSAQLVSLVLRRPAGGTSETRGTGDTGDTGGTAERSPQVLSLSLSGGGELRLGVTALRPGGERELVDGDLVLALPDLPGARPLPPYAALLRDVLRGERALFTDPTALAETWRIVEPLLARRPDPLPYAPGSWGPEAAGRLPGDAGWVAERG